VYEVKKGATLRKGPEGEGRRIYKTSFGADLEFADRRWRTDTDFRTKPKRSSEKRNWGREGGRNSN